MKEKITSLSNPIIKHIKSLHKKKGRWKSKNFFVEGVRAVEESIISKAEIDYIIYSDSLLSISGGKELLELATNNNYKIYYVDEKILKEISDTEKPQGIIAVIQFTLSSLEKTVKNRENFIIILDRIQDPGNMGTIIRTADAFGATGIIVTNGCVDIYSPKVIRATMGSIFHLHISYTDDVMETINCLKKKNINIISTSLEADNYCRNINYKDDFALIVGNEGSGVSDEIIKISDYITKIPMEGMAESLNVAIATGIIMYEASIQRQNF